MLSRTRNRVAAICAVALGSGALALGVTGAFDAGTAVARHHHCHIPQHNRGDHDRDNRGGPSDGDGCI